MVCRRRGTHTASLITQMLTKRLFVAKKRRSGVWFFVSLWMSPGCMSLLQGCAVTAMQMYTKFGYFMRVLLSALCSYAKSFPALLYPETCSACSTTLVTGEKHLCTFCLALLPRTGFHMHEKNPVARIFWGRVMLETATALFYYHKGGMAQSLIMRCKYQGDQTLGEYLGYLLGLSLADSPLYEGIHTIVPVPLHKKKKRIRGFNQAEVIARGIARALHLPVCHELLVRCDNTGTQTKRSRFARWQNVSDAFATPDPQELSSKSILLVDDVVTTGSTLEACAVKLLEIPGVKIWVAVLGFTA